MMDPITSYRDEFPAPETAKALDRTRSSRKLKRSKAKLAALGLAATVAAGGFAAFQIGSANAADVTETVTVPVRNVGQLCGASDPVPRTTPCFASLDDMEREKERLAINEANVQASPGVCGTPAGEPNPTRGDTSTATIDKFSAERWRVTMVFRCADRDNASTPGQ